MKYIVLFLIVLTLMGLPVYMLDTLVLPELTALKQVYGGADATVTQLVANQ